MPKAVFWSPELQLAEISVAWAIVNAACSAMLPPPTALSGPRNSRFVKKFVSRVPEAEDFSWQSTSIAVGCTKRLR